MDFLYGVAIGMCFALIAYGFGEATKKKEISNGAKTPHATQESTDYRRFKLSDHNSY